MESEKELRERILALSRPKITLPQQPSPETLLLSFSELLAGAMASPSVIGSFAVENSNAAAQIVENSANLGLGHCGSFGFLLAKSPFLTIPSGLSPSALLNSPAVYLPAQSPFGMSHQQALAHVTAQAALSRSLTDIRADEQPSSNPSADACPHQSDPSKMNPSPLASRKPTDDGYNWRKYGQKPVRGTEHFRSYYKCTYLNCGVKRKVESRLDGEITHIIYKGQHNHEPPQLKKRSSDVNYNDKLEPGMIFISKKVMKQGPESSQATSMQLLESSDSEGVVGTVTKVEKEDENIGRTTKKRRMPDGASEPSSSVKTIITSEKSVLRTRSEIEVLNDGYRWRKYGQKIVKGSHHPRSYYKCTHIGCPVRKHIERASEDPKSVITTYEGKHNHDVPCGGRGQTKKTTSGAHEVKVVTTGLFKKLENRDQDL